jgi:hypothetical protein
MCLYPRLLKNKKYQSNKKNRGLVPPVKDKRVLAVPIGCGNCMECRNAKKREWQVRLHEEIRYDNTGQFVTLSFSDEELVKLEKLFPKKYGYDLDNAVATKATRRFLERWRKKYKKSVKHWLVTELGQTNTERIHLHGILWTTEDKETISNIWKYGNVWIGDYVNEKTINYIVKYVNKIDPKHKEYKSKILPSPGLGKNYLNRIDSNNNKFRGKKTNEMYRTRNGTKIPLPIYYRNKIYTEEEREKLWLLKLDKQVRYVNGKEIDISNGLETYLKVVKEARIKNSQFGFRGITNWNDKKYEEQQRALLKLKRTQKVFANGERGKKR